MICCGILPGLPGQKWEPILILTEDEIEGYIEPSTKETQQQEPKEFHQEPVIEFKNNYEDENFIKTAINLTVVILVLTVIAKIYLILTNHLNTSSITEIFLILIQIISLILTIVGYKNKKSYTKYLSLFTSIMIVLSFDLLDVIIGIIYFIFSVDQGYFISLNNFIKEKIKKKK